MELSTLNYPTSYVTSLILKDKELSVNELNDLHQTISRKQFGAIRKRLVRQGLVLDVIEKKLDKVLTINDTEISDDKVRELINLTPTLMPKQLNALYPTIPTARFNALRYWLFIDVYKQLAKDKRIAEIHKLVSKKNSSYVDKHYEKKEENRIQMATMVYESGLYGLIPSLSHIDCLVERKLEALTDKNTFLNIDRDKLVVEGANLTMQKYGLKGSAVCGDMLSVLKKYRENDFAHVFMDFCGSLPIQGITLDYVIKNDLVGINGYIFLTISNAVRKVVNGYAKEFNSFTALDTSDMDSTKTYLKNKRMLKSMMGDKFIEVVDKPYQTGSPMLFYVMKRIK
jgi:hypothetical protein